MSKYDGLEGTKFYRWNIISKCYNKKSGHVMYNCICDCGNYSVVYAHMLVQNKYRMSRSCGCYQKEVASNVMKTHGKSQTKNSAYRIWAGIKQRCTNPNNEEYDRYGGSGIAICKEWDSFENFYNDMGERPSKNHSIDRINNELGYSKSNCKWSTIFEQAQNKKVTVRNTNGGYVGVTLNPASGKYYSRITVNKKVIRLGTFETKEIAFEERLKAEILYFGRQISKMPK